MDWISKWATDKRSCELVCGAIGLVIGLIGLILLLALGFPWVAALFAFFTLWAIAFFLIRVNICGQFDDEDVQPVAAVAAPVARAAPQPKPEPQPEPEPEVAAEPEPEPTPEPEPAEAPESAEGARPARLDAARGGKPDDLKQIKGVGPKLEQVCNSLGIFHFDQIAAWSPDEIAWVDDNLEGFKGRVTRDDWVAQAKVLALGGETDFSKRVEDGDVY